MRLFAVLAIVLLLPAAGRAAQQDATPREASREVDVTDLIRAWRHKPPPAEVQAGQKMIVAAPIIGSNPSAGFLMGVAGQMAFYAGDPKTTRISAGVASLSFSTKKQVLVNVRFDAFSDGNRWLIEGDNRFQSTSQDIYGFGTSTPSSAALDTKFGFVRVHETVYRAAAKDVYIGAGFLFDSHTNVRPADESNPAWSTSPYILYSQQHGLPTDSQQSAGVSLNVLLNRRDNDISARRGWMAGGSYRWSFDGLFGGDSSWQQFGADARAYLPIDEYGRHRLAFWTYTSIVTSGIAPYFDTPTTVMDTYGRSARAYQEGRYRGEKLVYGEVEYRGPLMSNGLLGMVAFANLTTVSNKETGERLFDSLAPGLGGGLRLLLNKRSRTNLCVDVAWGKDGSKGVYLAIQDAF